MTQTVRVLIIDDTKDITEQLQKHSESCGIPLSTLVEAYNNRNRTEPYLPSNIFFEKYTPEKCDYVEPVKKKSYQEVQRRLPKFFKPKRR